jgi:hypothetical protein
VAVVLTLVQTKQVRLNIHKRNDTKNTVQTIIQNTVNTTTSITIQVHVIWLMRHKTSYNFCVTLLQVCKSDVTTRALLVRGYMSSQLQRR